MVVFYIITSITQPDNIFHALWKSQKDLKALQVLCKWLESLSRCLVYENTAIRFLMSLLSTRIRVMWSNIKYIFKMFVSVMHSSKPLKNYKALILLILLMLLIAVIFSTVIPEYLIRHISATVRYWKKIIPATGGLCKTGTVYFL